MTLLYVCVEVWGFRASRDTSACGQLDTYTYKWQSYEAERHLVFASIGNGAD